MPITHTEDGGIRTMEPHEHNRPDYLEDLPVPEVPVVPEVASANEPSAPVDEVAQEPETEEVPIEPTSEVPDVSATPAAVAHAEEFGVDLTQVEGTGKDGTIIKADVAAVVEELTTPTE